MSRLGNWLEQMEELLKARKRAGIPSSAVDAMNAHFGAAHYGDRQEVAHWINENGGEKAIYDRLQNPVEGSMEHKAKLFIGESRSLRRVTSDRAKHAALHTDSITGPISETDRAHHAHLWAAYHEHVEHKAGGIADEDADEYGASRVAPKSRVPIQQKANHIEFRDDAVAREGHSPYHSMNDIRALHRTVHAMADQFTPHELNHFHVMHDALHEREASHQVVFGDRLRFKPSWSSIEPAALGVMHKAAQMMHHTNDDHARLVGATGAALRAQETHPAPYRSRGEDQKWKGRQGYPALHPAGSPLETELYGTMDALYKQRGKGERKQAPTAKPTVAPPSAAPSAVTIKNEDGSTQSMSHADVIASERAKMLARRALNKSLEAHFAKATSLAEEDPIAYPAIRLQDGTVVTGEHNHAHAARQALAAGHSKQAVTRALLIDKHGAGFVTKSGKYLPRHEAFQVAAAHDQLKPGSKEELERMSSPEMDSGDVLWRRSFAELTDYVRGLAA